MTDHESSPASKNAIGSMKGLVEDFHGMVETLEKARKGERIVVGGLALEGLAPLLSVAPMLVAVTIGLALAGFVLTLAA